VDDLLPQSPRTASLDPRAEVDRIISAALAAAERSLADAARRSRDERRQRARELARRRDTIAASAREVHSSTVRAVESMASAAETLVRAARAERASPPRWRHEPREPIEVKLSEVREVTLRFASGERG
jgi:hypothetical protein